MSGAITAAVGGAVVSGFITSKGAKDAASTQAKGMSESARIIQQEGRKARTEILNRMAPALDRYGAEIDRLQEYVANGTMDVMDTLQNATGNAMQFLTASGANARQALLGSAASATGTPRQEFDAQFNAAMRLPPQERDAALSQIVQTTGIPADSAAATSITQPLGRTAPTEPNRQDFQYYQPEADEYRNTLTTDRDYQAAMEKYNQDLAAYEAGQPFASPGGMFGGGASATTGTSPTGGPLPGINAPTINMTEVAPGQFAPGPDIGFAGADARLLEGQAQGLAQLASGTATARGDIVAGRDSSLATLADAEQRGLARLDPYSDAGRSALEQEAALSGALGPEAQQAAIDSFIESPGQKYLREQQEKSLLRNSAAIGGLGGGRVRSALMEQAMGIAATQQQSHLENLRSLAGRGQQADTTGAGIIANTGSQAAGIQSSSAAQLAQLAEMLGVRGADLSRMTAQERSSLAQSTGINLAQLEQVIGAAQAGLLTDLGSQLATTQAGGISDVARLGETGETNTLNTQQNISTILSNLATQQGTSLGNLAAGQGAALAAGQVASSQAMGQMANNIGTGLSYTLAQRATPTPIPATPTSYPGAGTYGVTPGGQNTQYWH
jgi:hypothetical protein